MADEANNVNNPFGDLDKSIVDSILEYKPQSLKGDNVNDSNKKVIVIGKSVCDKVIEALETLYPEREIVYHTENNVPKRDINIKDNPFEDRTYTLYNHHIDTDLLIYPQKDPNIVAQSMPRVSDKISRNSLCQCNSGKKAKKCCHK